LNTESDIIVHEKPGKVLLDIKSFDKNIRIRESTRKINVTDSSWPEIKLERMDSNEAGTNPILSSGSEDQSPTLKDLMNTGSLSHLSGKIMNDSSLPQIMIAKDNLESPRGEL